jgi:hypothetical protein
MAQIPQDPNLLAQVALQRLGNATADNCAKDSYIIQLEQKIEELEAKLSPEEPVNTTAKDGDPSPEK